mgnify:CR=1 FL=1
MMKKQSRKSFSGKSKIIIGELKVLTVLWAFLLVVVLSAIVESFEVLVAGEDSDSINVSVSVLDVISISLPADVKLSDILGTGLSTGSAVWNVKVNSGSDWQLELAASTIPAMTDGGNYFADYTENTDGVPEVWSVDNNDSEFGFSVSGDYSLAKYFGGTKYEGFSGSSKIKVAEGTGGTPSEGADITVHFKAEVGVNHNQMPGDYNAVITATASTL